MMYLYDIINQGRHAMNIALLPQLALSSSKGWAELERTHPSVAKLFFLMVIPLSALPPVLLHHAGTGYGDAFFDGASSLNWGDLSLIFFLAEMATFAAMGWWIRESCRNHQVDISLHDSYLLAAIAPVPLWLSALSLLIPSIALCVGVSLVALVISGAIIYHGAYALSHMKEEIVAATIANETMAAGLLAWMALVMIVALPVLGV
jgi:hypothetical protein